MLPPLEELVAQEEPQELAELAEQRRLVEPVEPVEPEAPAEHLTPEDSLAIALEPFKTPVLPLVSLSPTPEHQATVQPAARRELAPPPPVARLLPEAREAREAREVSLAREAW